MKKPETAIAVSGFWNSGGEEEDRTPDLSVANAALSQLSYFPEEVLNSTQEQAKSKFFWWKKFFFEKSGD